LYWTL